jgi:predicted permease
VKRGWLLRAMLRLVPRSWRETVAADLEEEARAARHGHGWVAARSIETGLRLRSATTGEVFSGDVRSAVRALTREAWSSMAIVLTLALGIGATTAVYAVFNHVSLRPIPGVADPDSLVTIVFQPENEPRTWSSGSGDALRLFAEADLGLEALAVWEGGPRERPVVVHPGEDPRLVNVEQVSANYLETLGVRPRIGRLLTPAEASDPGAGVVLVSEVMWRREFGGASDVLGRRLSVSGSPFVIVGVVDDYRGWNAIGADAADVFLPAAIALGPTTNTISQLIARPRPGMSTAMLQTRLRETYEPLRRTLTGRQAETVPWVYPGLRLGPISRTLGVSFGLMLGIAGLLLVLACVNAANLLIARTVRRRQDLALRAALGASRWRLVRTLTVEAALLAFSAVLCGLAMTLAVARILNGVQVFDVVDPLSDVAIDWRVASFASAAGIVTILLFALAPILSATRVDLRQVLQESSASVVGSARFRRGLVAVQLGLSLMLMAGAGVLAQSLGNLRGVDTGMQPAGVYAFTLNPGLIGLRGSDATSLRERTIDAFRATPGVIAAGTASPHAFLSSRSIVELRAQSGAAPGNVAERSVVSPGYFEAVGVPLLEGRGFGSADAATPDEAPWYPAIVSASLARALSGDQPALGRRFAVGAPFGDWERLREVEVVGVAGDTRTTLSLRRREPAVVLYEPTGQDFVFSRVYVRSAGPVEAARSTVFQVMREVEPRLPLVDPSALSGELERLLVEDRALTRLLVTVAIAATLLGFTGVYAVSAYLVTERTREFGLRIALGATSGAIVRHAEHGMLVVAGAGSVLGLAGYSLGSQLIAARLFGISALDPVTLAGATMLLAAAAAVACWLPARRAARTDPAEVLRST